MAAAAAAAVILFRHSVTSRAVMSAICGIGRVVERINTDYPKLT